MYLLNFIGKHEHLKKKVHCPSYVMIITCIEVKIAETSYVGLHLFCKISRHILPSAYTEKKTLEFQDMYMVLN